VTIELIHADCLDIDWPQVDAIITDVPYGTTACKWDVIIPFPEMWAKIKGSLKPRGAFVTTASQPFTSALVMSNPKWFKYEWIWHKNFSGGFATAKIMPMKYHENVLVFCDSKTAYNPQFEEYAESVKKRFKKSGNVSLAKLKNNHIQGIKTVQSSINYERGKYPSSVQWFAGVENANGKRLHRTQKPVTLYEYLIKTYTNEGDTVLDFCFGSCTTGEACINTGRNFIGIEKELKYYNIGKERLGL